MQQLPFFFARARLNPHKQGVPVVSYRNVAWPHFSDPAGVDGDVALWTASPHPSDLTHQMVADVLHHALQAKAATRLWLAAAAPASL